MKNPNPTGAEMVERTRRYRDMILDVLPEFPRTRGDDQELQLTIWRKYYWRLVRITTKDGMIHTSCSWEDWRELPSYESLRRRRQEIHHEQRELIWNQIISEHPELVFYDNSPDIPGKKKKTEEQRLNAWRNEEEAKKEFEKLAKNNQYLPSIRVIRKRKRAENAYNHEHGTGQLTVSDYMVD